jgi:ankyrin repeat protein
VVKLLLEEGAELETKDNYGQTPLSLAAGNGYEAVVKLLLEKGAQNYNNSSSGAAVDEKEEEKKEEGMSCTPQ